MQMGLPATILGTVAATSSTIAFVAKIWKTGGKDVSHFILSLYLAGVTLWLSYGLVIGATALSLANADSIVFAGTCFVLRLMKEKPRRAERKRLRIAIDMDETIADSFTERIRRYNAEFAESTRTNYTKSTLRNLYLWIGLTPCGA